MGNVTNESHRELEIRLTAWIAGFLRAHLKDVSLSSKINFDLGVDGTDGADLIQAFGEEFTVDVSNFPRSKYFGPEAGLNPLWLFCAAINLIRKKHPSGLEPLHVQDLFEMARSATQGSDKGA